MGNFLNLVYDNWPDKDLEPNINCEKQFGQNSFRRFDGLLQFFNFKNFKKFRLTDVGKHPDENFYYVIGHIHELGWALKARNEIPLPETVIKSMKDNKNLFVIFINEHEIETEETIILLNKKIISLGLEPDRFYVINNNYNLSEYKKRNKLSLNFHTVKFLPIKVARELDLHSIDFKPEKESNFFMCHNRTPKLHRYALLVLLRKNKLLQEVDWSLVMGWNHKDEMKYSNINNFYRFIFTESEIKKMKSDIDFFEEIDIKKSRYEEWLDWFDRDWKCHVNQEPMHIEWNQVYDKQTYQNSYINITTESCFSRRDVVHLSEKTFKPFFFHQFPLYVASANHAKITKDVYGFDLFEDVVDHSYDSESDDRKRLFKLFEEIKRLYKNKQSIMKIYPELEDRFLENENRLISLLNNTDDAQFFASLIKR